MNNRIKRINSNEITIQLQRAEVQKNILIKNIYKEYEIYFQIVRKSLLNAAEKGIIGLYSKLSINDKGINLVELNIFLNKKINSLIHPILPFITIEQLMIGDISDPKKKLVNVNTLKELVDIKEYQEVNFDNNDELITKEPLEFHCNNNLNTYEYYENFNQDDYSSINLDEYGYLNSFSKENDVKKIEYEKHIVNSVLELIEEINDNKFNDYANINDHISDVFVSSNNIDSFEFIDKSFNHFLLNFSYKINLELFKINLIKKIISEDTFKCLSNNNYIIKNPDPFVIRYDLNIDKLSSYFNKSTSIYLFNITNVELEYYNLDLSNCRNNINVLKNRFRLLNKKQRYWKDKQLIFNNLN